MKSAVSKPLSAVLLTLGVATFLLLTVHLSAGRQGQRGTAPPATGQQPAAPRGEAQGRGAPGGAAGGGGGGGRGGAAAFGDGPWDLGEGPNRMHITIVTKGLDHPWALAFVPGGDMLVTERPGRLRVIR
jgi:glucose/arabinose dehydrogenase